MAAPPATLAALAAAVPADLSPSLLAGVGDGTGREPGTSGAAGAVAVVDVTHDSRQVVPGALFVCIAGARHDGHDFAQRAVASGAVALLVERELDVDVAQLVVSDARRAHGHVAAAVHGHPATGLTTVGITGTNGKTTTTHLLAAALTGAGRDVRVLGTLSGARTTPEASDLQRTLAGWRDEGADTVVMEVSSHALALGRVEGMRYDAAVFTNLGRDHLDLHGTPEAYFEAKARLFTPSLSDRAVVNVDDAHGRALVERIAQRAWPVEVHAYRRHDAADVRVDAGHHRYVWRGRQVTVPLGGDVNVANSLAALTTSAALDVDLDAAIAGLASAGPVPGRFELVAPELGRGVAVVVDYAHTPDGLTTLLTSARALAGAGRVLVVVGCGGDRDRAKRPLMGAAAASLADVAVVTSDNPRTEDPGAIIGEVLAGVPERYRDRLVVDPDRRAAIGTAVRLAHHGDVVVIAGKGHETTQTIGATALPFDDRVVAREILEDLT